MKTLLLLLAFLYLSTEKISAQYCGNSGPSQYNGSGTLSTPGFTRSADIPCLFRGQLINQTIDFNIIDSIILSSGKYILHSFRIDSINDLPSGLCWSTNRTDNTYSETVPSGCIKITGVTTAVPGQYKLRITGTFTSYFAPFQSEVEGTGFDAKIFLRVIDQSYTICPSVDNSQDSLNPVIAYTGNYQNVAEISGKVFFDMNQNQVFDNGEPPVRNQLLNIGNSYVAITNSIGDYTVYPSVGNYTLIPARSGSSLGLYLIQTA